MEPVESAAGGGWEAGVNALREGRIDDAIMQLQAYVGENPGSFEGNNFLGIALAQAQRPAAAISFLQRATQLNPSSAQAHYNLGLALLGTEQIEAARAEFTTALQIDPQYAQAQQALQRLPVYDSTINDAAIPANENEPLNEGVSAAAPDSSTPWGGEAGVPGPEQNLPSASDPLPPYQPRPYPPVDPNPPSMRLTFVDVLKAFLYGIIASIIGAFIWDKITFYTNTSFSIIAIGVGILVGMAISIGASGKQGIILKIMGALLSVFGLLLGQALIIMDFVRSDPQMGAAGSVNTLLLFLFAIIMVPASLMENPLTALFILIGVWQGWAMAGSGAGSIDPAPINPDGSDSTDTTSNNPPTSGWPEAPSAEPTPNAAASADGPSETSDNASAQPGESASISLSKSPDTTT